MILNDEEIAAAVAEYLAPEADDMHRIMRYTEAIEAAVIRKLVVVSVEPVASDNPDFMTIPVEYQYAYPDGTWRCSNGDAINGMKPTAARALYARKDSQ